MSILTHEARPDQHHRANGDDDPTETRAMVGLGLVTSAIERFDESRAALDRIDAEGPEVAEEDRAARIRLRKLVEDRVRGDEASLAYLLDATIADLVPEDRPIDCNGEFVPFGVIRNGVAYIVRHDPGNMDAGIITTIRLDRLVEV